MKLRPALTLVELVLTMSLIAILAAGTMYAYAGAKQRYALKLSSDGLANELVRAHIFSREDKGEKSWGIKVTDDHNYAAVSRDETGVNINFEYSLAEPVVFAPGVTEIWFDRGTGNTANNMSIGLVSPRGGTKTINITPSGVITVQ
jgi:type II secretory pathway pseudopilin PulG